MEQKIKEIYQQFCKETGRSGGVLVHSSIGEWHKYLAMRLEREENLKILTEEAQKMGLYE